MAIYALVSNGLVVNTIKADADFISLIEADYTAAVDVTDIVPQPAIGWAYVDDAFVAPIQPEEVNG
jgi:hypothetical protein